MATSEGERLLAFEAAIEELSKLQSAAARFRELRPEADKLFGELMDLGRTLRQAARRGVFSEDAVDDSARQVRRLRDEWHRRLEAVRGSEPYQRALQAYAADDQALLGALLPSLFADLGRAEAAPPLFRGLVLTAHRRAPGSPFHSPLTVAADVDELRRDGIKPRGHGRNWWDAELAALPLADELAALDTPAALSLSRWPSSMALMREADSLLMFTPCLHADLSVVLAETSDDSWYEASEGSYEAYRDALAAALGQRGIVVEIRPAWS